MIPLCLTALLAAAPDVSVLVLPVSGSEGVNKSLLSALTDSLTVEMGHVPGYRVVSMREVENTMSQEQLRQLTDCSAVSCAAEIAGAMATEEIVMGTLNLVGETYLYTASRVNAHDSKAVQRVSRRVPTRRPEDLLDVVPSVVRELFPASNPVVVKATPPEPVMTTENPRRSPIPWIMRAGGGGVLGVGVLGLVAAAGLGVGLGIITGLDVMTGDWTNVMARQHGITRQQAIAGDVLGALSVASLVLAVLVGLVGLGVLAASVVM